VVEEIVGELVSKAALAVDVEKEDGKVVVSIED